MIEAVPLRKEHLAGFEPDEPLVEPLSPKQFGQAVAFREDDRTLAICGGWIDDRDRIWLGVYMIAEMRRRPVALQRHAKIMVDGLRKETRPIFATARDVRSARWLRHLGFIEDGEGFVLK